VGGLVGLLGTWLLVTVMGSPVPTMLPIFYLPVRFVVIGLGLIFALGILAGILPALQAMRLEIAHALRRNA